MQEVAAIDQLIDLLLVRWGLVGNENGAAATMAAARPASSQLQALLQGHSALPVQLCVVLRARRLRKPCSAVQGAKSQQELAKLVAENLLAFDSKFWLRMATRADAAESREDKERLTALANVRGFWPCTDNVTAMQ